MISVKKIREFIELYPKSESALIGWYRIVKQANWENMAQMRAVFPSADLVGRRTVFNIMGGNFRLIARLNYASGTVFILYIHPQRVRPREVERMKARTLDRTKYGELLLKALPRVLHNDKELDEFTQAALELEEIERPSREEQELAELLSTLIEQYEEPRYPIRKATPLELVAFLLDQRALSQRDLWPVIGSKGIASEILSGKRGISVRIASKLGEFFHVDPALFINWGTLN